MIKLLNQEIFWKNVILCKFLIRSQIIQDKVNVKNGF